MIFLLSKTLKLYNQMILPKDLSSPMVIKLLTFWSLNFLCDIPLKATPEDQLIQIEFLVYVHVFNRFG